MPMRNDLGSLVPAGSIMKRLLISTTILALCATYPMIRSAAEALQAQPQGELWEVGRCYRVYPHDRDTFYGFRVLEAPKGQWVRALPDPPPMQRPGMPAPAPFWLNTSSLFGVQEWSCAEQR
jgi:hypothetical protein